MNTDKIKITTPDGTTIEMPMGCLADYLAIKEGTRQVSHKAETAKFGEAYNDDVLKRRNMDIKPTRLVDISELKDKVRLSSLQIYLQDKYKMKVCNGMITLLLNLNNMPVAIVGSHRWIERSDCYLIRESTNRATWDEKREEYIELTRE